MPDLDPRAVWPGWETVRLIGRGSFGAVYEIRRDMLGHSERAALKVITIPQNENDLEEMISDGYDSRSITSTLRSQLQSIVNEYAIMRRLNGSTNVVNCDDVRYEQHADGMGWDIFIKMELLTPLPKTLPARIPEGTAVKLGRDICRALVLCRHYDVVHRDIKPQNIFVSELGDYKLGDFGIAKTVEKTSGGTKIGTYKYMAPEVYNNQPYGHAADIYSLGMVLYWLLNERRMPFLPLPPALLSAGMEDAARARRFAGEPIPAPAHGSPALQRIVLKALAFDPAARYESAADMLRDLEALDSAAFAPAPADGSDEPAPEEDGTVGAFARSLAPGDNPAEDEEEGTQGVFNSAPASGSAAEQASAAQQLLWSGPARDPVPVPAPPAPAPQPDRLPPRPSVQPPKPERTTAPQPMSPGGLAIRKRLETAPRRKRRDLILIILLGVLSPLVLLFFPWVGLLMLAAFTALIVLRRKRYRQFTRQQLMLGSARQAVLLQGVWSERPTLPSSGITCGERAFFSAPRNLLIPYADLVWVYRQSGRKHRFCLSSGEEYTIPVTKDEFTVLLRSYLLPAVPGLPVGDTEENRRAYEIRKGSR